MNNLLPASLMVTGHLHFSSPPLFPSAVYPQCHIWLNCLCKDALSSPHHSSGQIQPNAPCVASPAVGSLGVFSKTLLLQIDNRLRGVWIILLAVD